MEELENRPMIAERVGRALASGDLRQRLGPSDLDKVIALGMVGISERLADAVFRVKYANDPKEYESALLGVYGLARALDVRERWRYRRWRLWGMARAVFAYWLMDICPLCTGVRFVPAPGTGRLTDVPCQACHGEGKRAMPWLRRLPREPEGKRKGSKERRKRWERCVRRMQELQRRHRTLLCELEVLERVIGDKMVRKLAERVRSV